MSSKMISSLIKTGKKVMKNGLNALVLSSQCNLDKLFFLMLAVSLLDFSLFRSESTDQRLLCLKTDNHQALGIRRGTCHSPTAS